ncbi:MAG: hypothetical protein ABDH28_04840 [Brevinematia bacterium]
MRHVTLEEMLLSELDEKRMEHIRSCEQCRKLYESVNIQVDNSIIGIIDSKVKESVLLKFREMKTLGKIGNRVTISEKFSRVNLIKYALGVALSFLVIVMFSIFFFFTTEEMSFQTTSFSVGNNIVKIATHHKVEGVKLKEESNTIFVYLPKIDRGRVYVFPDSGVSGVVLVIGNQEYRFQTAQVKATISGGKLFVDGREIKPVAFGKKYRNVIFLKDGREIEGNLIGIKEDVIIFETDGGIREFYKKDVEKIKYSY